jgi:inner membrane protein
MDNLTHALCATALAKSRLGRADALAPAALVVAANLPDLDAVTRFWGKAAYLVHHRGITHALAGLVLQFLPLGAVTLALRRPRLLPAIAVGLLSHPLLDLLNTYGVRPWLPFAPTRWHGDLAFIVDPWLWLLFGGATALAGPRSRWGSVALALTAAAATWFLYRSGRAPAALEVAWPAAVAALAVARARVQLRARPVLLAAAALTVLYLGLNAATGAAARARALRALPEGERARAVTASVHPADPFDWTIVLETEGAVFWQPVRLFGRDGPLVRAPSNLDDPRVRRVAATPAGRAWLYFARHPMARVDGESVLLMDGRYQLGALPGWPTLEVPRAP